MAKRCGNDEVGRLRMRGGYGVRSLTEAFGRGEGENVCDDATGSTGTGRFRRAPERVTSGIARTFRRYRRGRTNARMRYLREGYTAL